MNITIRINMCLDGAVNDAAGPGFATIAIGTKVQNHNTALHGEEQELHQP